MSTPAETRAPNSAAPPPVAPRRAVPAWLVFTIAMVGVLAGAGGVVVLKNSTLNDAAAAARGVPTPSATSPEESSAAAGSPAPGIPATSTAPKWTGGLRRSRGRNLAVYELEAGNEVAVWGKVVRPLLTVRCVAGTTEVFVFTQSAAALEGNDGRHTVRIGYDRRPDATERWLASADYDALFAEDGVAAARRIAAARTMRFSFTPFNGAPVLARFDVAGFDAIASRLAQTCRWK